MGVRTIYWAVPTTFLVLVGLTFALWPKPTREPLDIKRTFAQQLDGTGWSDIEWLSCGDGKEIDENDKKIESFYSVKANHGPYTFSVFYYRSENVISGSIRKLGTKICDFSDKGLVNAPADSRQLSGLAGDFCKAFRRAID